MTQKIPIGNVETPRHLECFVFTSPTATERVRMEVYTGWIRVSWYAGDEGPNSEQFVSFIPVKNQTTKTKVIHHVRDYVTEDNILDYTVTASVSGNTDDDDERNVITLDKATVKAVVQEFGEPPNPKIFPACLVLRAYIQARAAYVHHITYQVTVLSKVEMTAQTPEQPTPLPIDLKELELEEDYIPRG
jgi:hypothetical protein